MVKPSLETWKREVAAKALDRWGHARQCAKAQEELAELIVAIAHRIEGRNMDNIYEEIADVEVVLAQLRTAFGDDRVDAMVAQKLTRLERKIEGLE